MWVSAPWGQSLDPHLQGTGRSSLLGTSLKCLGRPRPPRAKTSPKTHLREPAGGSGFFLQGEARMGSLSPKFTSC